MSIKNILITANLCLIIACSPQAEQVQGPVKPPLEAVAPIHHFDRLDNGHILSKVNDILIHEGNVYLSDTIETKIFKTTQDGLFRSSFGQQGPGPGEFELINNMLIANNRLYVSDEMRYRLSIFDLRGTFIRAAQLNLPISFNFTVDKNERFYVATPYDEQPMAILDAQGKLEKHFGEHHFFSDIPSETQSRNIRSLFMNDSQLLVVSLAEPYLERYNLEGEQVGFYEIKNPAIRRMVADRDRFFETNPQKRNNATIFLFGDAIFNDGMLYLLFWNREENLSRKTSRDILVVDCRNESFEEVKVIRLTTGIENERFHVGQFAVSEGNELIAYHTGLSQIFVFDLPQ